jgi:hypothetical protein
MICPKCNVQQPEGSGECQSCGIVFAKYLARQNASSEPPDTGILMAPQQHSQDEPTTLTDCAKETFLFVPSPVNPFYFAGRVLALILIFIWGWKIILSPMESNYVGESFMHLINLPFHEAGHVFFRPFGQFIMMLGGSIGQVLMPLICFLVLLLRTRDTFGASVALWWLGESFMDLAPYINDARALKLILIGGVTGKEVIDYHDWEFILRKLRWLNYDHTLAHLANTIGILFMMGAFVWGGYLLVKQYKNIGTGY